MHATLLQPSPALAAAYAAIEREFSPIDGPREFKRGVRALIRRAVRSPGDPTLSHLFRQTAERLPVATLDTALEVLTRDYKAEKGRRFMLAANTFCGPRVGFQTTKELRLILRWLRAHAPQEFVPARNALLGVQYSIAAE